MTIHPLAGKPAPQELLVDIDQLSKEYYARKPDITDPRRNGLVSAPAATGARRCGAHSMKRTSWQSPRRSVNTAAARGSSGPLYIGKDTHALSEPAFVNALEVLAANGVETMSDFCRWLYAHPRRVACHPRV